MNFIEIVGEASHWAVVSSEGRRGGCLNLALKRTGVDISNFIMLFVVHHALNCYLNQFKLYCRQYWCEREGEWRVARLRWWRQDRQRRGLLILLFSHYFQNVLYFSSSLFNTSLHFMSFIFIYLMQGFVLILFNFIIQDCFSSHK